MGVIFVTNYDIVEINKRVQKLIEEKGFTHTQFANEVNVKRSVISHVVAERNRPGVELLQNILERFPDIDPKWLLLGQGTSQVKQENTGTLTEEKTNKERREVASEKPDQTSSKKQAKQGQLGLFDEENKKGDESKETSPSIEVNQEKKIRRITVYFSGGHYEDFYPEDKS